MNPKVNYTLVGVFVVLFSSALIAWTLWLGVGTEQNNYKTYVAYMYQSVSGLNVNAEVKYRGVEVGKVKSISLDPQNPERVKLLLDIEEGTPIKEDSIATLSTQGLTGLSFIELSGGSKEAPPLRADPGEEYPEIETGPSLFVRLDTAINDAFGKFALIAEKITDVSNSISTLLNHNNQQAIQQSLGNIEQITTQMNEYVHSLGDHLLFAEEILKNTAQMSEKFPTVVNDVSKSMQGIQEIVATVGKTSKTLDQAVLETQQEVSRSATDTLTQLSQLLGEIQRTSQTLNRLLLEFERNPNMFIFGRRNGTAGPGER